MKISRLLTLLLIPATLAFSTGCSLLKKKSPPPAPADATAAAAPTPTPAPAPTEAPAPKPAKAPKAPVFQDVVIHSIPDGAVVKINGQSVGNSPLSASLELGQTYKLELFLPGYLISTQTLQARSSGGGGVSLGKSGMVSYHPAAFPSEIRVSLSVDKDPFRAMTKAVAALDAQLDMHKISPDAYKEKVAEVTRFYSQGK
jgi:hypothetical protein